MSDASERPRFRLGFLTHVQGRGDDADRLADSLEHRVTRRRRDGCDHHHDRRCSHSRHEAPARAPRRGRPLLVCLLDDRPRAALGISHSAPSLMRSSPRRRRELTVPRGRSSSSAISPGVYSRM